MNDPVINLALIGRLIRHRWPLLLVVALVGALAGFGSSFVLSPGYESTGKVLLGGERDSKQLPGEAQIATSLVVLDKTAAALGRGETGTDLQDRVSASVDGNVIAISGAAPSPAQAQQLAQEAIKQYIDFSTQIVSDAAAATADASKTSRDAVQKRIDDANGRITAILASPNANATGPEGDAARAELDQEKNAVTQASKDLDQIDNATQNTSLTASVGRSTTRVIEMPAVPDAPASPTVVQLVAAGALLGLVLAVFMHLIGLRSDRRLRDPGDVAAALGAPVLGHFDVDDPSARPSLVKRVLRDDRRWTHPAGAVAEDDRGRAARGERILRRVVGGSSLDAVVLTFDDDPAARSAVPGLAVSASRLGPVTVVTTDEEIAAAVRATAADEGVAGLVTVGPAPVAGSGVLRSVSFPAGRPAVPDVEGDPAILLAVTAGRRTGWELTSVVGACADVGQVLTGCVLVTTHGRGTAAPTAKPENGADSTDRAALAGSS